MDTVGFYSIHCGWRGELSSQQPCVVMLGGWVGIHPPSATSSRLHPLSQLLALHSWELTHDPHLYLVVQPSEPQITLGVGSILLRHPSRRCW